jgi:hypothetical protein
VDNYTVQGYHKVSAVFDTGRIMGVKQGQEGDMNGGSCLGCAERVGLW